MGRNVRVRTLRRCRGFPGRSADDVRRSAWCIPDCDGLRVFVPCEVRQAPSELELEMRNVRQIGRLLAMAGAVTISVATGAQSVHGDVTRRPFFVGEELT